VIEVQLRVELRRLSRSGTVLDSWSSPTTPVEVPSKDCVLRVTPRIGWNGQSLDVPETVVDLSELSGLDDGTVVVPFVYHDKPRKIQEASGTLADGRTVKSLFAIYEG